MAYSIAGIIGGFALTLFLLFCPEKYHKSTVGKWVQFGIATICAIAAIFATIYQDYEVNAANQTAAATAAKLEQAINQGRRDTQKSITEVGARLGDVKSLQDLRELQQDVFRHVADISTSDYIAYLDADLEKSRKLDAVLADAAKEKIANFQMGWQSAADYYLAQFDARAEKLLAAKRADKLEKNPFRVLFTNASEYISVGVARRLVFSKEVSISISCWPALFENGIMTKPFNFQVFLTRGPSLGTLVVGMEASLDYGSMYSSCLKPESISLEHGNAMNKPEIYKYMDSSIDFAMREALKAVSSNLSQENN